MLELYMVTGAFCYGAYSEVLVAAESAEEAKALVLEEAKGKDGELFITYSKYPDEIEVEAWGALSKGVICSTGADI